jgi:hypothetical protein
MIESGSFKGITLKGRSPTVQCIDDIMSGAVQAIGDRFKLNDDDTTLVKCTQILNLKAWPIEDASFGGYSC